MRRRWASEADLDENLAAQAELALERQGVYDSLCYESVWHTNGQLGERAAGLATGLADLGVRPGDRLQHRAQGSALVPSMIQMLLSQPLEEADLSELTAISSGAAPLSDEVRREFEARVPNATIYEGHPAVAQAGVVGRPDARLGEEVVAFVSLRPGAEASSGELTEHARQHLAASKYPRQITIVDALPLTSVGKLDRKKLRQRIALEDDGGKDLAGDLAEADPRAACPGRGGGDRHLVRVLEEGPYRPVGQGERL